MLLVLLGSFGLQLGHTQPFYVAAWGTGGAGLANRIPPFSDFVAVEAGYAHALGLRRDGSVAAWGDNSAGQATPPVSLPPVRSLAAGYRHSAALLADGTVVCWGDIGSGQCSPPPSLTNVVSIAAGGYHNLALTTDGRVEAWGSNDYGQSSVPTNLPRVTAVTAGGFHSIALGEDGAVYVWGFGSNGLHRPPSGLGKARAVVSRFNHTLALLNDGSVVAWGANTSGQTNVPAGLGEVVSLSAGRTHSAALTAEGALVLWGDTGAGVFDAPAITNNVRWITAGDHFTLALVPGPAICRQPDGVRWQEGASATFSVEAVGREPLAYRWQRDGVDLPAATNRALVLDPARFSDYGSYRVRVANSDGEVWSRPAQLLVPPRFVTAPESQYSFPNAAVMLNAEAIGTPPVSFQWYSPGVVYGGATNSSYSVNSPSAGLTNVYFVVATNPAGAATSAVAQVVGVWRPLVDFAVWQPVVPSGSAIVFTRFSEYDFRWIFNGQEATSLPRSVTTITNARPSDSGIYQYAITTIAGDVMSTEVPVTVAKATRVDREGNTVVLDVGDGHGTVRAFQWYHEGHPVEGATNSTLVLGPLLSIHGGDYTVELTDAVTNRLVEAAHVSVLPAGVGSVVGWGSPARRQPPADLHNVVGLFMDANMAECAVLADGSACRWGEGVFLGATPDYHGRIASASYSWGLSLLFQDGRDSADAPDSTNRFVAVAQGGQHSIGLRPDGTVILIGAAKPQMQPPSGLAGVIAIDAGAYHCLALKSDGTVVAWGEPFAAPGPIPANTVPANLTNVVAIAAGATHNLALKQDGSIVAWGNNDYQQLAVPAKARPAKAIFAKYSRSYAVTKTGVLVGWGDNGSGQNQVPAGVTNVVAMLIGTSADYALIGVPGLPAILEQPVGAVREIGEAQEFLVRAWSTNALTYQWKHNGSEMPFATNAILRLSGLTAQDEGDYCVEVTTRAGIQTSQVARLNINPQPYLRLPTRRGELVAWGDHVSGYRTNVVGLNDVVAISGGGGGVNCYATNGLFANVNMSDASGIVLYGPAEVGIVKVGWLFGSENRSIGLRANGTVHVFGDLPDGVNYSHLREISELRGLVDIACNGLPFVALRQDGSLVLPAWSGVELPGGLTDVVQVASSEWHVAALRRNGSVVCQRRLVPGPEQVLQPNDLTNITAITGGAFHMLALREDGTVAAWGHNTFGECSVPPHLTDVTAIAAGAMGCMALRKDHTVVTWGNLGQRFWEAPADLTNVVAIAADYFSAYALVAGPIIGRVPVDATTRLGTGAEFTVEARAQAPISYQWSHEGTVIPGATNSTLRVAAVKPEDTGLYQVELESDGFRTRASARLQVGTAPVIAERPDSQYVFQGAEALFSVRASGNAPLTYQWQHEGVDLPGETNALLRVEAAMVERAGLYTVKVGSPLGFESTASAPLVVLPNRRMGRVVQWGAATNIPAGLSGVIAISAGRTFALALRADGTAVAWGDNAYGTSEVPLGLSHVRAIASSGYGDHALALREDGSIVGWGHNYNGQASPPSNSDFTAVAAGSSFSVAARAAGSVLVWGNDWSGLRAVPDGLGPIASLACGNDHVVALRTDGTVVGWGQGEPNPPPEVNHHVASVAAGHLRSALVHEDGTISVYGWPHEGDDTVPGSLTNVSQMAVGYMRSLALKRDGTVVGWGDPAYRQPPAGLSNVIAVALGDEPGYVTLALVETGCMIVEQPADAVALEGQPIHLRVRAMTTSPATYQWIKGTQQVPGATNATFELPLASSADTGRYQVIVTTALGDTPSREAQVTVQVPPHLSVAETNLVAFDGAKLTLEVQASGDTPLGFRWFDPDGRITGKASSSLALGPLQTSQSGVYVVEATNNAGLASAGFRVAVLNRPATALGMLAGETLRLEIPDSTGFPLQWQWFWNGTPMERQTNAQVVLANLSATNAVVSVRVRMADGLAVEASTQVLVEPLEVHVVDAPRAQSPALGTPARFEIHVGGEPPFAFQWAHDGRVIPGATNAILELASVDLEDAGSYAVSAVNGRGRVETLGARLDVMPRPNVVAWGTNAGSLLSVPPDLTNVVAVASGEHALAVTEAGVVIGWGRDDWGQATVPLGVTGAVAVAVGQSHSLALLEDGRVVAWGDNRAGQTSVPAGLTGIVGIACGANHSLAVDGSGNVVAWGSNTSGQTSVPSDLGHIVDVAAMSATSLALMDTGTVRRWGKGVAPPAGFTNLVALAASPYLVLGQRKDGALMGWHLTGASTLQVEGPPHARSFGAGLWYSTNKAGVTSINTHAVAARADGKVVSWGANLDPAFTPPVGLSNVTAVAAGVWHDLAVVRAPQILRGPRGGTFAVNDDAELEVEAVGDLPHRLQWELNGQPILDQTNAILRLSRLQPAKGDLYTVVVTGAHGMVRSVPAEITVQSLQPHIVSSPQSQAVSQGEPVSLRVVAVGQAPLVYQWRHNGELIPLANEPVLTLEKLTEADTGLYEALVGNSLGNAISQPACLSWKAETITIDNRDAALTGVWSSSFGIACIGSSYYKAPAGGGFATMRFTPTLPRGGRWLISAHTYPFNPLAVATPYRVQAGETSVEFRVDATAAAGWQPLGEFLLPAGATTAVTVSDAVADPAGWAAADAVSFAYAPQPPRLFQQPQPVRAKVGASASLRVGATGGFPLHYQWQRQGQNVLGATSEVLNLDNLVVAQSGVYRALVWNLDGAVISEPAELAVVPEEFRWEVSGEELLIRWDPIFTGVQSATNVAGPYVDLIDAPNPLIILRTNETQRFFRLQRQ